jgi:RNA polymerase sigma-70 factor (family 1)
MSSRYMTYPDEDLLTLMHEHEDELAFGELYNRYFRLLYNYSYEKVNDQFVAQEIVQELFVSLWQHRHRQVVQACRPYLFSVAKNLVISYYRKEFARQRHYSQWGTLRPVATETSDQQTLTDDLQHRYEKGLTLLPGKCREVFVLSRQGMPNREIAQALAISEKTVEQHITKALRLLRIHLKEHLLHSLYLIPFFQ